LDQLLVLGIVGLAWGLIVGTPVVVGWFVFTLFRTFMEAIAWSRWPAALRLLVMLSLLALFVLFLLSPAEPIEAAKYFLNELAKAMSAAFQ
jgi:hypothetical protein